MSSAPILVTGFEPFGGESLNASWEAVRLLPDRIAGRPVERMLLPVEFGHSGDLLCAAVERLAPAAVVMVGEAGGRAHLTVETVALNLMRARIPDNAGAAPQDEAIIAGGPDGCFATLAIDACVDAARAAGVPAERSASAGLYVCNQLMYRVLYALQGHHSLPAGFVHVPYLPQQVLERPGVPFCPAEVSARGIEAICQETLSRQLASNA